MLLACSRCVHNTDVCVGVAQGMSEALADTCKRSLDSLGVRIRKGRVTKVSPGQAASAIGAAAANPYLGKAITIQTEQGRSMQEASDLVLWTAGASPSRV